MTVRVLFALALCSMAAPAAAAAQAGVSVQGSYGSHLKGGGDNQSVAVGYAPSDRVQFVVSAERLHLPTEVSRYENGYGATRGGTTKFISGEVRFSPFTFNRVTPYALAGLGRGSSRPNVNEIFPNRPTDDPAAAMLLFFGGGVRVPVTGRLSAFADVRSTLQVDNSGDGGVYLFLPVRAGLAWRF